MHLDQHPDHKPCLQRSSTWSRCQSPTVCTSVVQPTVDLRVVGTPLRPGQVLNYASGPGEDEVLVAPPIGAAQEKEDASGREPIAAADWGW